MGEIDRVILELQSVFDMLRREGDRLNGNLATYASLNHAAHRLPRGHVRPIIFPLIHLDRK